MPWPVDHYCTPGYVLDEFQDHVASSKAGNRLRQAYIL